VTRPIEAVIVSTGTANLASITAGLERAGAGVRLARDPEDVLTADRVVLPGVGAFAPARERLADEGLDEALCRRIEGGAPLLAICLGLQLLTRGSAENPGVPGLGIIPGTVNRFSASVTVPQLGWNRIETDPGCCILEPGYAYFANSYRLEKLPAEWRTARADHGGEFVAALERGGLLACQFHPELSGAWGTALLRRWLYSEPEGDNSC
jgi:imidazole glycerol phosphate synthase glutamine amidotransferase subunit